MSDALHSWFERLYGSTPGLIALAHHDGQRFHGTSGFHDTAEAAAHHAAQLDEAGGQGVYHRVTTLVQRPARGQRGGAELSLALPGLWADVDFGSAGHKHDPTRTGRPLPPDAAAAWRLVDESGLPRPSLWVHTGGGLYPWWLLDIPLLLDDEQTRATAQQLSERWQEVLQVSAHAHGWDYGAGVGDLARVLRVPGTTNRKTEDERPCRVVQDDGTAYTLPELLQAAMDAPRPAPPPRPEPRPAPAARPVLTTVGDPSPFDTLDEHVTFDDLLDGAGWTRCRQRHGPAIEACWTRPGDPDNPCSAHTLTAQPHVLVVHSEAAGLPTGGGQRLTRGRLFAHLHHGGDERAAARDLAAAIDGRTASTAAAHLPLPRRTMHAPPVNLGTLGVRAVELEQARVAHEHQGDQLDNATHEATGQAQEGPHGEQYVPHLEFFTLAQLRARVRARGKRKWLLKGLWPAGDYGVHAAEMKAQKTWNTADLAVAVASGTPWLGLVEVETRGPVVMFVGEGGEGNTLRRLDAAAEERGIDADALPIHICTRAPHLNDAEHMAEFANMVASIRPALVTLDPLYLAARGAELGDLYKMGAMLEGPQRICQANDASLWVVTHFNRGGNKGAFKITGAGPAEWGRVLITAEVKSRRTDTDTLATDVITHLEAIGGEIPGQSLRLRRHIQAEDPDDLDSPLHLRTETTYAEDDDDTDDEAGGRRDKPAPAARKLLAAMDAIGRPATSSELVDHIVNQHGHGLTRETTSRELNKLLGAGVVDCAEEHTGTNRWPTKTWWRAAEKEAS